MTISQRLFALARKIKASKRGNVLMIFAFAMIPMVFATGMGIDYARAARLQTKLNALADAAALAAVTQPMMQEDDATAKTTATKMFNAQAAGLSGLIYDPADLTVTITDTTGATIGRTVKVSYIAESENSFGGVLGKPTIAIGGSSTANATKAPNIDFYLMVDTSPSMLLPATTSGLAAMTAATGGCAFACHETDTSKDNLSIARSNGIVLRTDLVAEAVEDLTDVATSTMANNHAVYRMGLSDFDYDYRRLYPTSKSTDGFYVDSDLTTVKSHVPDAQVVAYCSNNYRVCGVNDNDTSTDFTTAFNGALDTMPTTPGSGTNNPGDTPQAILFVITDGMRDEGPGSSRKLGPIPTAQCTTIKNRGIRIAILYTEYLPASASDGWSQTNVKAPYLSPTDKISPALISCASPGLYYKVTTDDDISGALAALFQQAVATAHLTQ